MRGGCTVQQALTTEAANVVKQAVNLAKRRGHAQVTPLHVATTMLAPPAGLLRTACLQSQSHSQPLQCRALDVCINVALNRLPASSSSPILCPPQSGHPGISNALVAAFKRAQAHQRRGSVENQQQPLLAVKIELEQLIISILDDPSVSRVMREAGFSSTQVKINVEKAVSLELCSQTVPSPLGNSSKEANDLHPVTIPGASLSLSLIPESDDIRSASESMKARNGPTWLQLESGKEKNLKRRGECSDELAAEAGLSFQSSTCTSEATTSTLPSWLQQHKDQTRKHGNENDQEYVPVKDLSLKWNSFSSSPSHKQPYTYERTITFSCFSPSSSINGFSYDHQNPSCQQTSHNWPIFEPKQYWSDQRFSTSERSLTMYIPEHKEAKRATFSNPNSTSSSDVVMETENSQRFKEWNSENLETLCAALEKRVPWQKDIIPEIASAILQCRSGMVRRREKVTSSDQAKEDTWLFFQGVDVDAKEAIARELGRLVFGSNDLVSISLSSFSSNRADSTEDLLNKRSRDEQSCSYIERFGAAVAKNPHRVFLVEDVEQVDYCSQMGIKKAIERGRIIDSDGNEVSLCDAIVILSCESFSSRSRAPSPPMKQNSGGSEEEKTGPCVSLDLNISFDEDEGDDDDEAMIDGIGLLESVDKLVFFKIQEL